MFLSLRQQRLKSWEQKRAKGKLRFIAEMSLRLALPIIVGLPLAKLVLGMPLRQMLVLMIGLLLIAPFAALVEWWKNEGAYIAAKLDKRMDVLKKN